MVRDQYKECLDYIDSYWDSVIHASPENKDDPFFLYVPNSYITPNNQKFSHFFYWDSYFMFRGLMGTRHQSVMKDVVENFMYLFNHFGIVPNFNSHAATNRSQPPFLSSMMLDVFQSTQDKEWLQKAIQTAKDEYTSVWIDNSGHFNHTVESHFLSRYGDRDVGYSLIAELESGWDFTSRFYNRCNEFLPVDLNAYLAKYEHDFMYIHKELVVADDDHRHWNMQWKRRQDEMNRLMWNEEKGFYFDYDHVRNVQSPFYSLAGFTPLWAGLASVEQAEKVRQNLHRFETQFGLTITAKESLPTNVHISVEPTEYTYAVHEMFGPKQWDYPNIWAPLEYLAVIGLLRYGFVDDASRIMKKSLDAHNKLFHHHKTLFEKIDGESGDFTKGYHYPNQLGFGWTNGVFFRYVQILNSLEEGSHLYTDSVSTPPFNLAIAH